MRVMALLMQGKSNKAICRALGLAEPTVKRHVSSILKAFRCTIAPRRRSQSMRWDGTPAPPAAGKATPRQCAPFARKSRRDSAPLLDLPDKPSIVVLPFANLSGDPAQDYFADGMVDEITVGARPRFRGSSSSRAVQPLSIEAAHST